ncbi:MAG TPA: hypothetical protein VKQ34_01170 [Candidatus Saccharimonadales bacterium]|nr:hypothetical protein [Candidatus Saccharimonadales bacterium]
MFGQKDDDANVANADMSQSAPADTVMPSAASASAVAPAQPGDDPVNYTAATTADSSDASVAAPVAAEPAPAAAMPATGGDDLLEIKQQALQQLSPLIGHLDQTPEEKFRTTMMMIQAADNATLIKEAYAAAQQIDDEKVRAQALLDIINEINYFTQHHDQ